MADLKPLRSAKTFALTRAMRVRYMSVNRSHGPPVRAQFLHPIHQPTLNKGSQGEFALARTLFLAFSRIRHRPTTRGAARRIGVQRVMNSRRSEELQRDTPLYDG